MNFDDISTLLDAPGVATWTRIAPVIAGLAWIWLTALLWRGGFRDLAERARRGGGQRLRAWFAMPFRAIALSLAAAIGAGTTVFGLWVQVAVILTIVDAVRLG